MFCFNRISVFIVFFLIIIIASVSGENISSNIIEKAKTVTSVVVNYAVETGTMRDMALIAVRNSMAAENDAEEVFLVAIKSGDKNKQIAARKVLDEISGAAEESKNILQKIADYAGEAGVAAELAKRREKAVMSATVRRDAASELKKLQKLADTTLKTTNKARVLADIVKRQWLLPVSQPKSSAVPVVEPAK